MFNRVMLVICKTFEVMTSGFQETKSAGEYSIVKDKTEYDLVYNHREYKDVLETKQYKYI